MASPKANWAPNKFTGPICVLSLDGGGIRGLIPALIMQRLEKLAGGKTCLELFDVFAGTSTGGLLALLTTTPDAEGNPRHKMADVVELYKSRGGEIFVPSTAADTVSVAAESPAPSLPESERASPEPEKPEVQKKEKGLLSGIKSVVDKGAEVIVDGALKIAPETCHTAAGVAGKVSADVSGAASAAGALHRDLVHRGRTLVHAAASYSATGLEKVVYEYVEDVLLSATLKPVVIPTYDIDHEEPFIFSTLTAQADPNRNFPLKHVARATSAAPTFFPPCEVPSPTGADPAWHFIDGGVAVNNPSLTAYSLLRNQTDLDIVMVSIGTGQSRYGVKYDAAVQWGLVQWARPLLEIIMDGGAVATNQHMQLLLPAKNGRKRYFRLQVELEAPIQLDKVDAANIDTMVTLTEKWLDANEALLQEVLVAIGAKAPNWLE